MTRLALNLLLLCATATARPPAKPVARRPAPAPATAHPDDSKAREAAIAAARRYVEGILEISKLQQAELKEAQANVLVGKVNEAKVAVWGEEGWRTAAVEKERADKETIRADKNGKRADENARKYARIKWPLCAAGAALAVFVCLQFGLTALGPVGWWATGGAAVAVFGALAVWL